MNSVSSEMILVVGYAVFLVAVAGVLELVARHVHRRSAQAHTVGFTFHRDLDLWECPDGRTLQRIETDADLNIVRYRAEAHHCNACAFKFRCTDSDSGRVIEHRQDSWLDSGLYRFHRGISSALLVLATMILLMEMLRSNSISAEFLLSVLVLCIGTLTLRLLRTLRTTS